MGKGGSEIIKVGRHTVSCGSVADADLGAMLAGQKARVLYSDPPWSDGNLKFWATLCRKQSGKSVQAITYEDLLQRFRQVVQSHTDGYVFLEVGVKQADMVGNLLGAFLQNIRRHRVFYRGGKTMFPNIVFSANTPGHPAFDTDLAGMSGYAIPKLCVRKVAISGGIVLDPFCGMGYSGQAAIDSGMIFVGNELNRHRLNKTIKRLEADAS